ISTYIPARRASKITAIDAIRQSDDIKLSNKVVKTSKLTRKLFGIEAEIGLKNLKRNKRKYQATVISLVVSIVLFLSVSYFIMDLKKATSLTNDMENYDLQMSLNETDEQIVEQIESLDKITGVNMLKRNYFNTTVPIEKVPEPLRFSSESTYRYSVAVNGLKDKYLQAYAKEIDADFEQLKNGHSAIVIENVIYPDDQAGKYVETKVIDAKVGDTLTLDYYLYDEDEYVSIDDIEIAALTNQLPIGVNQPSLGDIIVIVSEDMYNQLEQTMPVEINTN